MSSNEEGLSLVVSNFVGLYLRVTQCNTKMYYNLDITFYKVKIV